MIKQLLTGALLCATPMAISAADNLNVMPWVNGTEWSGTSVEKKSDGTYQVHVSDNWAGAGIDFAADHPDFPLTGYTGVHIDVTADGGGNKMVYVNYSGGEYDEHSGQANSATYYFKEGLTVEKIVFKFENAGTYLMREFTLLAPNTSEPVKLAAGEWNLNAWGEKHTIGAETFSGIKAGDNLIITYSARSGAEAQIYAPRKDGSVNANSASEACHLYITRTGNFIYAVLPQGNNATLTVKLDEDMVSCLQRFGLVFEGHDVTFTNVSHIPGNPTVDVEEQPEQPLDPVTPAEGLGGTPMGVAPRADIPALFDNDPSTAFRGARADRAWAGLDLGQPHIITKVKWMAADNEPWKVNLGIFEGANKEDFSDAIPIHIIRGSKGAGEWNEATITCSRGFRYVRYVGPRRLVNAAAGNGAGGSEGSHAEMAELRFFGHQGAGDDSGLYRFSNLPTVVLNTVDMEEPHDMATDPEKDHDLTATLTVIGADGKVVSAPGITRERGNYSRTFPKRPLRMKFDKKNTPVSDAKAKKKKWELLNNYGDKTLMRNLLAFDIARMMGMDYVPFCTPVDVILNGEYRGCYQLADSKEVDDNRVAIHEMSLEEALAGGESLTGGYFLEVDAYADEEPAGTWFTTPQGIPVTVKAPDDKDVLFNTSAPLEYITGYYSEMASRVSDGKYTGPGGYREMLDVESFLQLLMTNEIGGNKDVMWSFNMYKDLGDPHIYSGPAWDFDVAFDNSRYIDKQAYDNDSYLYLNTPSVAAGFREFTEKVMSDPQTAEELRHLWGAVRDNGLSYESLADRIDHYAQLIQESQQLNFERWPILDTPVHDNAVARGSFEAEVAHVKDFCRRIISHFDSKIGYTPGEHTEMVVPVVSDEESAFRLTLPYGRLMVRDQALLSTDTPAARTPYVESGYVNADKEWVLDKSSLDADHLVTVFARHAGRDSQAETYRISRDGTISAVDTPVDDIDDNSPKEYFTLTGVRVDPSETSPGVYVCRQGSKATKIILR
ncbi:MAG: CotH kinase family protein [Muribaculaceae bacterium]|nr:CotH kinase family protein [Muribaculaceae bacterium]